MPTGVVGPLGYSISQVGGLIPRSEIGLHPLMYEEALTSYPPRFMYNRQMVSPLTLANKGLYTRPLNKNAYGTKKKVTVKEKKITKAKCIKFLESGKSINPLTGRQIKKNGTIYKLFMKKCKKYINEPVKENKLNISGSLVKIPKKLNNQGIPKLFRPSLPKKPTTGNKKIKLKN